MKQKTSGPKPKLSLFKVFSSTVLFTLTASVLFIFIADFFYINKASVNEIFTSPDIHSALVLTIVSSFLTTVLAVAAAVPSAYALSRFRIKGSIFLDILIDLLIVIPVLVIGVSILVFFRMGTILSDMTFPLSAIGMMISALGNFFIYHKAGIILAQFFCSIPYALRVIKSTFDNLDPRTEHVALTLGCSQGQAFRLISLPMARKGIMAGAVLAWARAFGLFGPVAIVAGAVRQKTEVLATSIYLEISIGRLELAIAISLLMVIIASIVLFTMRIFSGSNLFGTVGD